MPSAASPTPLAVLALGALALAGCSFDGSSPYAGMTTWEDATHAARVRYLESPWHQRGGDGMETLDLEVDPVTGPDSGVPAKYQLSIALTAGSAAAVLAADHAVEAADGEMDVAGATVDVMTDSGDVGSGWVGVIPGLFARYRLHVAFDVPGGRVLHLVFEANLDPRVPEIQEMLRDVDIQPFSPP